MIRLALGMTAVVAVSVAAVACSSGSTQEAAPTATPPPAPPTATEAPASPTVTPPGSPVATPASTETAAAAAVPTPAVRARPQGLDQPPGRIVFAGLDGQIYTTGANGSDPALVSPPRFDSGADDSTITYTWPGWSPDGTRVIFSSAVPIGGSAGALYSLVTTAADGSTSEDPSLIFTTDPGSGLVALGAPHYALFSPDGGRVAMIAPTFRGLAIFVTDAEAGNGIELILGAPTYLAWSPDSASLLVHRGDQLFRFTEPFGAGGGMELNRDSPNYLAPSYAPTDSRFAFLERSGERLTLTVLDEEGDANRIAEVDLSAAFRWSPDGESLAVLKSGMGEDGASLLSIVAADGSAEREVADGRLGAFQWSPDGSKILLAESSSDLTASLTWTVLDVSTGVETDLLQFEPTPDLRLMHLYFDQYAASHSVWSPDSRWVVLTGRLLSPEPGEADATLGESIVWIADTESLNPPVALAEGILAFWSPS